MTSIRRYAVIGPSKTICKHVKIQVGEDEGVLPMPCNKQESGWQDRFSVVLDADRQGLTVTRTDQSTGWTQNLQLAICALWDRDRAPQEDEDYNSRLLQAFAPRIATFLKLYNNRTTSLLTHTANIEKKLQPYLPDLYKALANPRVVDEQFLSTRIVSFCQAYRKAIKLKLTHQQNVYKVLKPMLERDLHQFLSELPRTSGHPQPQEQGQEDKKDDDGEQIHASSSELRRRKLDLIEEAMRDECSEAAATRPYLHARVLVVGRYESGKTALVRNMCQQDYDPTTGSTVGVDLLQVKSMTGVTGHWRLRSEEEQNLSEENATRVSLLAKAVYSKFRAPSESEDSLSSLSLGQSLSIPPSPSSPSSPPQLYPLLDKRPSQKSVLPQQAVELIADQNLTGEEMTLALWDFGGQDVFQSLHHLFLTRFALYLVVFDMRAVLSEDGKKVDECLSHLKQWMANLELHAHGAPVYLVGTYKDVVATQAEHEAVAKILQNELKGHEYPSVMVNRHTPNGRPLYFWPVDNTCRPQDPLLHHLFSDLEQDARMEHYVKEERSCAWFPLMDALRELSKIRESLTLDQVEALGREHDLDPEEVRKVLDFLHQQGRLLYYPDSERLRNVVVLEPTKFLVEPATRIICDFHTHEIEGHRKAKRQAPQGLWRSLTDQGILDERLLPYLWDEGLGVSKIRLPKVPQDRYPQILELMIQFGLAVELHRPVDEDCEEKSDADYQPSW
jgi:GTPase SAR1 family protein